jgi:putative ABC transport system ATP-binding protein
MTTDRVTAVSLIACRELTKTYRMGELEVHALQGVDLTIAPGEYVAIMGPSGSGKSTLMNMLGCLDTPSGGSYVLDGEPVERLTDDQLADIRNQKIGFVFQTFNLLPRATALANVELPLIYAGVAPRDRHQRAREALAKVGLGERTSHRPNEMSGGERQRVAVARALVTKPSLILADEPTGNLDSRTSHEIMALLKDLHTQGNTIILVTHEDEISRYAHRIVRLRDGRIESDEPNPEPR